MKTEKRERARILQEARKWIGTPYVHQTSALGAGCDCLGLVRGVWRATQGNEPERAPAYSSAWADTGNRELLWEMGRRHFNEVPLSKMSGSDVLLFRMKRHRVAKHLGIATGEGTFIHAYDGNNVVESALSRHWLGRIVACFRFPSLSDCELR